MYKTTPKDHNISHSLTSVLVTTDHIHCRETVSTCIKSYLLSIKYMYSHAINMHLNNNNLDLI